ncbi:hydrogenase expression protein [Legionella quinlivanii]|uniref:Hydrogenase expression protein n=1 Tax=Legionella quinlivanii TaxID=45073 RepID=A0A364LKE0_9GAMM|nr:methyltransferase [Legionella quinlivanii]RAP37033.1 hydrogenase expression protein [Legionella quinlivanii]
MKLLKWFKKKTDAIPGRILRAGSRKRNNAFYENYFSLTAAGARLKLVEAMFKLNLFALFESQHTVEENEIIKRLGLHPVRGKKWLHLLSSEHFLIKKVHKEQASYQLPDNFRTLQESGENGWWGMQFFFDIWTESASENLKDALQFGKVKTDAPWPPKTAQHAAWLEQWMAGTSDITIRCILEQVNFKKVKHFLDVGGGDGTMACAFVSAYPHLKATVYNLPASAEIARQNIESRGLSERIKVVEGNFLEDDAFPVGSDLIIFARVLFDWDETVARKLLRMAYQSLPREGHVAICEVFKDHNKDFCLACEYRYIFQDDFGVNVMKYTREYITLLERINFTVLPQKQESVSKFPCSVLLAKK